jgi:hypothetical protein
MISTENKDVLAKFHGGPPATIGSISRCEAQIGRKLPADYIRLMQQMNGGEGFIGQNYLMLWSLEELSKMNRNTYFAEAAPGLLVFGSDGGGEAFGFDTRTAPPPVVVVPYVGMAWDTAVQMAPSFDAFILHLHRSEELF